MSNTDGEDTQLEDWSDERLLIKRFWSRAYLDTEEKHIGLLKDYIEKELASLREQLKEKDEAIKLFVPQMEFANHTIKKFSDGYNELEKQLKQKEDEIKILTQDSFNLAKKLVEKEDENRELVKRIESHLYLFDEHGQMRHELELFIQKHKKNLSA